jgi:molybdate transport system substrate-binding protein
LKKRNLKQMVSLVLSLILITGLAACGQPSADGEDSPSHESEPVELVVFAAASMTETLTEIGEMYKQVEPHVTLTFNFDSSGTLKTQIEEGAACDIFISAAQKPELPAFITFVVWAKGFIQSWIRKTGFRP